MQADEKAFDDRARNQIKPPDSSEHRRIKKTFMCGLRGQVGLLKRRIVKGRRLRCIAANDVARPIYVEMTSACCRRAVILFWVGVDVIRSWPLFSRLRHPDGEDVAFNNGRCASKASIQIIICDQLVERCILLRVTEHVLCLGTIDGLQRSDSRRLVSNVQRLLECARVVAGVICFLTAGGD